MRLYLDEDSASQRLAEHLRNAGHTVATPQDVGTLHASDAAQFTYAIHHRLVVLTRNYGDFDELHQLIEAAAGNHPGVLVRRMDNDPTRDMSDRGIVTAIRNLEASGVPIQNQVSILNQWR